MVRFRSLVTKIDKKKAATQLKIDAGVYIKENVWDGGYDNRRFEVPQQGGQGNNGENTDANGSNFVNDPNTVANSETRRSHIGRTDPRPPIAL